MLANYIDQVVAEQRLAEISQEVARIRQNNQKPEAIPAGLEAVNQAPVIELNLMTPRIAGFSNAADAPGK